jgi:hypothetical protein
MIDQIDLASAQSIYAVSNTPLFLLRKLQDDPAPRAVGVALSGPEILELLKAYAPKKPQGLREAVEPYVLLVALSQKGDVALLRAAAQIEALHYDWLNYLANVLVDISRPTGVTRIFVPGQLNSSPISATSNAATQTLIIRP